jgi:hypothetical protein
MLTIIESDTPEYAAGWSIERGVLTLFGFDGKGKTHPVLELPLWHPVTGEWLIAPTDAIIE